ncbi:alpha-hydroxy acid oxidase [Ectopseudomonas alcaliphila]|uniref:alpha-hydroxy acid oxidase n=1 Tax=Ectopseudomonas alcaliphila TaxID=101564 RepID=UPI002788D958|nr:MULTISPECIES: alpha-hydroxy acid oxidase [Pseudomonas]MDP9938205.1 4-hydroxymandelate oxidase [Pseudomonas sp. 3400]MDR7010428.1 4-hydroxymandelate oxidase [Pseudomonas alcaliphila]
MSRLAPLNEIPADLVSARDYERYALERLDGNALAYLQGGAGDELTCQANLQAWQEWALLPRMLRDLRGGHTRCQLLGDSLQHPIVLAPIAYQHLFHAEGERASALAAGVMGGAAVLSSFASTRLEEVAEVAQGPLWFQLYWQGSGPATLALAQRAEAAGYRALVLTVDAPVSGVRNREQRAGFRLPPDIRAVNLEQAVQLLPLPEGGSAVFNGLMAVAPGWQDVAWLCQHSRLPVLLKGILHVEDARLAVEAGAAGVIVSNHGGRVLDSQWPALRSLASIRAELGAGVPVLVDGGIRRGSDVFKALALGADAVLIGRPYAHALATAGALGVAHLLRLLREELEVTMALCGCRDLSGISGEMVQRL